MFRFAFQAFQYDVAFSASQSYKVVDKMWIYRERRWNSANQLKLPKNEENEPSSIEMESM